MQAEGGTVREHVLQEMREAVHTLAHEGMPAETIEQHLNGGRWLSETEQDLVYLLIYHAIGRARITASP